MSVTFISASAGSGKTYTLTELLFKRLSEGKCRPECVIGTTFTVKAAGELVERVSQKLLKEGQNDLALRIKESSISTVNGICHEILDRYSFSAGLAPNPRVLGANEGPLLFKLCLEDAIPIETAKTLSKLSYRFSMTGKYSRSWQDEVQRVVDLARTSKIAPEDFPAMAEESATSLLKYFSSNTFDDLDNEARSAIDVYLEAASRHPSPKKNTLSYNKRVETLKKDLKFGQHTWVNWTAVVTNSPEKALSSSADDLKEVIERFPEHPVLHSDISEWCKLIFEAAAIVFDAFKTSKGQRGVIDFIDQESLCLQILENEETLNRIGEDLDLLIVDEFQDTSPIQLAIFTKLSSVAEETIWVGDTKQAIYGFRGSDPKLMDVVLHGMIPTDPELVQGTLKQEKGKSEPTILDRSWRTVAPLVGLCNDLFVPAFEDILDESQVALKAVRKDDSGEGSIEFWDIKGTNAVAPTKVASGIQELIRTKKSVFDRKTGEQRSVSPGDISILCRTNSHCQEQVKALNNAGIPSSSPCSGLLDEPEIILALAAFRFLCDHSDSLARAEFITLDTSKSPDNWLADRMRSLESDSKGYDWGLSGEFSNEKLKLLDSYRARARLLSPSEILSISVSHGGVRERIASWSRNNYQRDVALANLDKLEMFCKEYEETAKHLQHGVTAGGFIRFLEELKREGLDLKAVQSEGAVNVMTYHASKGLEWNIVICLDLDQKAKGGYFGVNVETLKDPSFENPLQNRAIRVWPYPFGSASKDIRPIERIEESSLVAGYMERAYGEAQRLLYVGFTRARDVLILGLKNMDIEKNHWLRMVGESWFYPNETLTSSRGNTYRAVLRTPAANEEVVEGAKEDLYQLTFEPGTGNHLPYNLSPSKATDESIEAKVKSVETIGARLDAIFPEDMDRFGNALHDMIAQGLIHGEEGDCFVNAGNRILEGYNLTGSIDPVKVRGIVTNLKSHLVSKYGAKKFLAEWPVSFLNENGQRVSGWIDLLVETDSGYIIVDHKSFPGARKDWEKKALSYASQLAVYKEGVELSGEKVIGAVIHLPIGGALIEVEMEKDVKVQSA